MKLEISQQDLSLVFVFVASLYSLNSLSYKCLKRADNPLFAVVHLYLILTQVRVPL